MPPQRRPNRRYRDGGTVVEGFLKRTILGAVAAIVLTTMPAAGEPPRLAQAAPDVLPPHEVLTIVRSTGLSPLDRPTRRGMTYVLRAIGAGGQEMRVTVDARFGDIMAVTPVASASRAAPGVPPGPLGPYEPIDRDGYLGPQARPAPGAYRSLPPTIYDDDDDVIYAPRSGAPIPPAPIPGAQMPRTQAAVPPRVPSAVPPPGDVSLGAPHVITAPEPGEGGLLPPPPERFPQRAAPPPAAKPAPAPKRAAAATPAQPPLPKPRPTAVAPAPQPAALPAPPAAPVQKPDDNSVPH